MMASFLSFVAAILLSLNTTKPASNESVNLRFQAVETRIDAKAEIEMLSFVNKQRQDHNLKPLALDAALSEVARKHSADMLARGYFAHANPDGKSPFDRMQSAGINYLAAGENIAYAPTTDLANIGLINSPDHRFNILSPDFNKIGIGVIDAGTNGKMFTQDFTD